MLCAGLTLAVRACVLHACVYRQYAVLMDEQWLKPWGGGGWSEAAGSQVAGLGMLCAGRWLCVLVVCTQARWWCKKERSADECHTYIERKMGDCWWFAQDVQGCEVAWGGMTEACE